MIVTKDINAITIERFFQVKTYYGLLEGVPNSEINLEIMERTKEEAKKYFGINAIYLIKPEEKKQVLTSGKEMASLPRITCMVELSHYEPIKNPSMECSRLCLIWFQNDYAFPIDNDIIKTIGELDWNKQSEDAYL